MASKAKPKKRPATKARVWTEVEDFYLKGNIGALTLEEIAKKLGRTMTDLKKRLTDLGIDIQASYADRYLTDMRVLNSNGQPVDGVVAMTHPRALRDEQASQNGGQQFMNSLRSSIAPVRP